MLIYYNVTDTPVIKLINFAMKITHKCDYCFMLNEWQLNQRVNSRFFLFLLEKKKNLDDGHLIGVKSPTMWDWQMQSLQIIKGIDFVHMSLYYVCHHLYSWEKWHLSSRLYCVLCKTNNTYHDLAFAQYLLIFIQKLKDRMIMRRLSRVHNSR